MINLEADLEVVSEAEDAAAALRAVEARRPDLLVVDLSLPGRSGLELIKDLAALYPDLPMLVLSMHDETLYAERALRAGARGYLMKSAGGQAVLRAIRDVLAGQIHVSPAVSSRLLQTLAGRNPSPDPSPHRRLSDREFEVFRLLGEGLGTREVARRLNIGIKTIETHRAHIKEKLGVHDAPGLVREAVRWVESQRGLR